MEIGKDGKTVPIPSIVNMQAALERAGINVTRVMGSDSAGGKITTAYGVGMDAGQLSHIFLSEQSGFVDLSRAEIIGGIALREQFVNSRSNRAMSVDPDRMTSERVAEAAALLDEYKNSPGRLEIAAAKVGVFTTLRSMARTMDALRRGQTARSNPLVDDTNALLARQPGVHISYALADHDPLYRSPETCLLAAQYFLGQLNVSEADVRVVIVPGTHALNTYFPLFYHAVKKHYLTLV